MARQRKLPPGMWKRGNVYYARFRDRSQPGKGGVSKLIQKRLSTDFEVARQALNEMRVRADRGELNIADNDYKWDDLKASFLRWAHGADGVRNPKDYERDLSRFEAFCRVHSVSGITREYVEDYREWRLAQVVGAVAGKQWKKAGGRTVSQRTVNREVATLHKMLNHGVENKKIGTNPIAGMKPLGTGDPRKSRESLEPDQLRAIFAAAPSYLRPALEIYCRTGMRRNELVELEFNDIDFEKRIIKLRKSKTKNNKERDIPLDDESFAILSKLRDEAPHRQPVAGSTPAQTAKQATAFSRTHVFVGTANTPLRNNLLRAFYAVCRRVGIDGAEPGGSVDLHSLRVTFATLAIENGASPRAVQAILGHSTLDLTMKIYTKATDKAAIKAVNSLPF
jgi:integrase